MNYKTYLDVIQDRALSAETSQKGITFIESASEESFLSYADLYTLALCTLKAFQEQGLKQGDTLVLFLNDNRQFLQAFWACLLGGIVPVPVAVGISDEHRSKLLKIYARFDNAWLWADDKSTGLLWRYLAEQNNEEKLEKLKAKTLTSDHFALAESHAEPALLNESDVAFIQFSSGSTRDPKGVVLTHQNLITTNVDMGERLEYSQADSSLSWMPLTHDLGLIGFHLNMVVFGMNQVLMPTDMFSRRPLMWLKKASEHRSNILTSPNFGFKHVLKVYESKNMQDEELDLSSVKAIVNGAEPISIALCNEFNQKMVRHGLSENAILPSYGLAEAALAVSLSPPGQAFRALHVERNTLVTGEPVSVCDKASDSTVSFAIEGLPVARCEVLIADQAGQDLGEDHVGEVLIKGPNVTSGYLNEPEANKALITGDGYLRTGDLGILHQGEVVITGRLKDIIFVSGQNYYPHDIENMVLELPDMELGKVVVCGARPNDASDDDILVCILFRGELSDFAKVAASVRSHINETVGIEVNHVLPVTRVPKTTSGKVQRRFFVDAYLNGDYQALIASLVQLADTSVEKNIEKLDKYQLFIKQTCETTLSGKTLSLTDNLFDIGTSSLEMAQIHEQIESEFPGKVDIMDVFDHPSIEALGQFLAEKDNR